MFWYLVRPSQFLIMRLFSVWLTQERGDQANLISNERLSPLSIHRNHRTRAKLEMQNTIVDLHPAALRLPLCIPCSLATSLFFSSDRVRIRLRLKSTRSLEPKKFWYTQVIVWSSLLHLADWTNYKTQMGSRELQHRLLSPSGWHTKKLERYRED